jgi:hypothetical protein
VLDGRHVGVKVVPGKVRTKWFQRETSRFVGKRDLEVRWNELGVGAGSSEKKQRAQENHLWR